MKCTSRFLFNQQGTFKHEHVNNRQVNSYKNSPFFNFIIVLWLWALIGREQSLLEKKKSRQHKERPKTVGYSIRCTPNCACIHKTQRKSGAVSGDVCLKSSAVISRGLALWINSAVWEAKGNLIHRKTGGCWGGVGQKAPTILPHQPANGEG